MLDESIALTSLRFAIGDEQLWARLVWQQTVNTLRLEYGLGLSSAAELAESAVRTIYPAYRCLRR